MPHPVIEREFIGVDSPTAAAPARAVIRARALPPGRGPSAQGRDDRHALPDRLSEHYIAEYMAARGIGFLGWNTRFRGFESSFVLDHALLDIGVGVRWPRKAGRGNHCAAG
jgi:hypothetical protein